MRNIVIEQLKCPVEAQRVEFVERKGIGHPDFICDACCESVSRALSKEYLRRFGAIAHHNVDKGLLVAGRAEPRFGGGKVIEPIKITVAGRAISNVDGKKIDVKGIALAAVKKELKKFRYLKDNDVRVIIDIKEGAANLREVMKRNVANDTSFGVGHWPLTRLEQCVKDVCEYINSKRFMKRFPAVGEDVKVLGVRQGKRIRLTVAIAFVDRFIKNMDDYIAAKKSVLSEIKRFAGSGVSVELNTLDDVRSGRESSIYLTVTGLSAEQGDDGNTGRGNRVNGLITPNQSMSLEAVAGKNINHPGKIYQVLAQIIAEKVGKLEGIRECCAKVVSQIGKPLDKPQVVAVQVLGSNPKIANVVDKVFDDLEKIQKDAALGRYTIF